MFGSGVSTGAKVGVGLSFIKCELIENRPENVARSLNPWIFKSKDTSYYICSNEVKSK